MTPGNPPAPLEWHPAYRDQTELVAWLDRDAPATPVQIDVPVRHRLKLVDPGSPPASFLISTHTLVKHRAFGLAPYVGRPFLYRWNCAVDELGRGIAGEAWIQYTDEDLPWRP